jgi:2-oxoglutarate ferredoxin oxidoreductase subunit beta
VSGNGRKNIATGLVGSGRGVTEASSGVATLTRKDFVSDQEVRWCPGCGDYAILAAVQSVMPEFGIPREKIVFVSGIGCSSRFPYYMNTYGVHGIHGRAPALATGVATARPDLHVWVVTGDGDGLSIGGNHLIHALRRNVNIKILLFNNQIYGLTKGQYSPTSEQGKVTKSTPFGSLEAPFNPLSVALGAEATFVARTMDVERKHLPQVLRRVAAHRGSAFVEIYQNCNIFNDGAFMALASKEGGTRNRIYLEHGKPIRFGEDGSKGVRMNENGRRRCRRGRGRAPRTRRTPRRPESCVRAVATGRRAHATDALRGLPRGRAARLRRRHGEPIAGRGRTPGAGRARASPRWRRHVDGRRLSW